jgi:uncharacterized membrane protein YkgB
MKIIFIYTASWMGMMIIAILNGVLREKEYNRFMRELSTHQLSALIGVILIGAYIWVLTGVCRIESSRQALVIGGMWLMMTVAFEFLFGHYVIGHPWSRLFQDYNLLKGRLWPVVLIWTAVAPYLFYRIRL